MRAHALLPAAALASLLALAPASLTPPGHAAPASSQAAVVVSHHSLGNALDGVYRGQKFVYTTRTGFPLGAPAGTLATLVLDQHTPVHSHGKEPVATVYGRHGVPLDIEVRTVEVSETEFRFVASEPLPRHAELRVRVLAVATAQPGEQVTSTLTAGRRSVSDTDQVTAMPKVTAISKTITDGREQARPGETIQYVATGSFEGAWIDGATLLVKQSPLAPITARPTLEVRDADGHLLTIEPERLLSSRYGDSLVLTVLGGVPQGATFTVRAQATVVATARPGDTITTEFGIGLNNWIGGKLVRAVDTTAVA